MKKLKGLLARLSFLLLLTSYTFTSYAQADLAKGEEIFKTNCTSCHKIGGKLIGPDLKGVRARWNNDDKKIAAFVKNPNAFAATDPYVKNLVAQHNGVVMTPQALSEEEIANVIAFADAGGKAPGDSVTAEAPVTYTPIPKSDSLLKWIGLFILITLFAIFLVTSRILRAVQPKVETGESKSWLNWQKLNPIIFPLFFIGWMIFTFYDTISNKKFLRPEAASDTGAQIDFLFEITLWVTGAVFFITQILLFYYAWRFRAREGKKAYFYPHNNTIEFIWTSVPAVVLAGLVLYGFKTWQKAMSSDLANPLLVEAYAEQFQWTFRYPGPDGVLGKHDFRKIDAGAGNPLGLDWNDPASHDDILVTELHLPKDKDVYMKLRSRDVTHAAYLPHFRMQMYANPGMDNRLPRFKPTITTAEMRKKINNPDFNYELACNQLCGSAHYNMRRVVIVEEQAEYDTWIKSKKPAFDQAKQMQTASK